MSLEGKQIVITGANGQLGRAISKRAMALGAKLVLLDIAFDGNPWTDSDSVQIKKVNLLDAKAVESALAAVGDIDGLMNIAGGFSMGPAVHEESQEDWQKLFDINVMTLRNAVQAVVPMLKKNKKGFIVNVGAMGAMQGLPNMGAYSASKSVVMRLTESLSAELKHEGVNVNAVLPSVIDTPANREAMPDADPSLWVAPEDLANVICFLASDDARAIHGALVPVTGLS